MSGAEVTPSELRFRFILNKQLPATISIHNPSSQPLAYKVKTTSPKKYVVRPSSGILDPHSAVIVKVIMQEQKEYPTDLNNCKDKFLVETVQVLPGVKEVESDTFKVEGVKGTKLRVVLEGPPAPPSPVPEVSENEEEMARSDAAVAGVASAALPGPAGDKLRSALDSLAAVTKENNEFQARLRQMVQERDELKRKLDAAAFHSTGGAGGAVATPTKKVSVLPSRLAILHMLLVAIIAFLVGHYT